MASSIEKHLRIVTGSAVSDASHARPAGTLTRVTDLSRVVGDRDQGSAVGGADRSIEEEKSSEAGETSGGRGAGGAGSAAVDAHGRARRVGPVHARTAR